MEAILEWLDKNAKGMLTLAILLLTITLIIIVFLLFITNKSINMNPIGFIGSPQPVTCTDMPVGMVVAFSGEFTKETLEELAENGWLPCNGSSKLDKMYPILSGILKGKYGVGDTPNEFRLPKLNGRFLRGAEKSSPLSKSGGQDFIENILIPDHDHSLGDRTNSITNWGPDPGKHDYKARDDHKDYWRKSHLANDGGTSTEGQHYHSLRGLRTGKGIEMKTKKELKITKIETIPSYLSVNFIIKAK